jgi:Dockerin type I domain
MYRKLHVEVLDQRLCQAFGDIDLNFADQGFYRTSYDFQKNAPENTFQSFEVNGGFLHFASSNAGSGTILSIAKTDTKGELVPSFGQQGVTRIVSKDFVSTAIDAIQLADGSYVVMNAAQTFRPGQLVGVLADGTLNAAFGNNGVLSLSYERFAFLSKIFPDTTGGFFILQSFDFNCELTKYDSHGNAEQSFGSQGTVTFPRLSNLDAFVAPTGEIKITGLAFNNTDQSLVAIQLLSTGSRDLLYGPNGTRSTDNVAFSYPKIDPLDGSVFIVTNATSSSPSTYFAVLKKFSPNLQPDQAFGQNGVVEVEIPRIANEMGGAKTVFDGAGGAYITASWTNTPQSNFLSAFTAKVTSSGMLDSSFGNGGKALFNLSVRGVFQFTDVDSLGNLYWRAVIQPNMNANYIYDEWIMKLDRNGALDRTWGANGFLQRDLTVASKTISDVQLHQRSGGKMSLVSGWPPYGASDFFLGKATTLDSAGDVIVDGVFGSHDSQVNIVHSSSNEGGYFVAQLYSNNGGNAIRISKALASGSLDLTFGTNGRMLVPTDRMEGIFMKTARDGSVVIAAGNFEKSSNPTTGQGVAVAIRLKANGDLDVRFGNNGILRLYEKTGTLIDVLHDDALGTILVFENSDLCDPLFGIHFKALDASGAPKTSFGNQGIANAVIRGATWRSGAIDEQGRLVAAVTSNLYSNVPKHQLYKVGTDGALISNFGTAGIVDLPIEFNANFDNFDLSLRHGIIAVAGTNSLYEAKIRLVALDYFGKPLTELGPLGFRDYEFSEYGESIQDIQFADEGSLWLAVMERQKYDKFSTVVRLEKSISKSTHNWNRALDVDDDGFVSPLDVLAIINHVNGLGTANQDKHFPDVDADGSVSPLDALIVVNAINNVKQGGEGESAVAAHRESRSSLGNEGRLAIEELFAAYQYDLDGVSSYMVNRKKGHAMQAAR